MILAILFGFLIFRIMAINPVKAKLRNRMIMCLSPSDSTRWSGTDELEELEQKDYASTLDTYVNETPKSSVLMIYGLPSVGKTRQLLQKIDGWKRENRMVIEVILKFDDTSAEKFLEQLFQEYAREINNIRKLTISNIIESLIGKAFNSFFYWMKILHLPSTQFENIDKYYRFGSRFLIKIITALILHDLKNENKQNDIRSHNFFARFLDILESKALQGRKPIFVIREVQRFYDDTLSEDTKMIYNSLLNSLKEYKYGNKNVSVILESSHHYYHTIQQYVESTPESFQVYQVKLWSKEDIYKEVVERYQIFTIEEYERVWNTVGGHPEYLYMLHDDLRWGLTLTASINQMHDCSRRILDYVIDKESGKDYDALISQGVDAHDALRTCVQRRQEFLKQLTNNHFVMARKDVCVDHLLSVECMCLCSFLWMDNNGMIMPIHQMMQNVLAIRFSSKKM